MLTYILILLCLPPLCAVLALAAGFGNNILHWLHRLTATAVGVCVALMAKSFNPAVPYVDDYFYIDALNMWVIIIITTLGSDVGSHRSDYLNQCVAHFL